MCWYSVESSGQELLRAEAGQRLGVRKMYGGACWVVKESDLKASTPAPVCLLDGTRVLFRSHETEQTIPQLGSEPEAVFRMTGRLKKDVFEFKDGLQIEVNQLPGLIFDVLLVPGKEHLSGVLKPHFEPEQADRDEPILARVRALLF